jgi:hypothetical protein
MPFNLVEDDAPQPGVDPLDEFDADGGEIVMPLALGEIEGVLPHLGRVQQVTREFGLAVFLGGVLCFE